MDIRNICMIQQDNLMAVERLACKQVKSSKNLPAHIVSFSRLFESILQLISYLASLLPRQAMGDTLNTVVVLSFPLIGHNAPDL